MSKPKMESTQTQTKEVKTKAIVTPLKPPSSFVNGRSPCLSPYLSNMPPVSPHLMKGIDPSFNLTPDYGRSSPLPRSGRGSTCSAESTSSLESETLTVTTDGKVHFDFQRTPSETLESNVEDIDFFLHVVGVFQDYVTDQIQYLETQFQENRKNQICLQKERKKVEGEATQQENELSRDFARLVSLLHQKQLELKEVLKKDNLSAVNKIREQEDLCRRNMKLISGILCFIKQMKNESGESLKENAVRQLKEKLSGIHDTNPPELIRHLKSNTRIDVNSVGKYIQSLQFPSSNDKNTADLPQEEESAVSILAPRSGGDVTNFTITVRWRCNDSKSFDLKWTYFSKGKRLEKMKNGINSFQYVIENLPPSCDVTVCIRSSVDNSKWSDSALFRTQALPVRFSFDADTANIKLKLTPDKNTVYFAGEKSVSPRSPSRFSFALNVLGSVTFYSGKHYWELKVNKYGWTTGVAYADTPRNGFLGSNNSSWILHHVPDKFEYKVRHNGESSEVDMEFSSPQDYLKRLGVFIDVEGGVIRFVDPRRQKVLHTYSVDGFEQPLCAAVNPFYHGGAVTLITGLEIPQFLDNEE